MTDNLNTQLQDRTIRHMIYLEGLKNREARQIVETLENDIIPDLLARLEQRLAAIEDYGFDRGADTTRRIEAMIEELSTVTARFRDFNNRIQGELFEFADDEIKWQIGAILEQAKVDINFTTPSTIQIRQTIINKPFDGRTLEQWFESLDTGTQRRLQQEVQRGVVEGLNTQQIVRNIRGTKQFNYADGVLQTTRAQTTAVVKTAFQHTANTARQELFAENAELMRGVQYVATLDAKTTPICRSLDGKIFPVDSGARPPQHVNCRSTIVPVLKSWEELGIPAEQITSETRASINGQVPGNITYNEWLRKQPRHVIEDALGVSRAKLYLEGNLDVSAFVNNRGKEFTLAQLRQKEAGAFKRAGL